MAARKLLDWFWPRPVSTSTPVLRMAAIYPNLLPKNATPEAYADWLVRCGEDPANPDLMEHYTDVCEVAGWLLDGVPPPVGTRADAANACQPDGDACAHNTLTHDARVQVVEITGSARVQVTCTRADAVHACSQPDGDACAHDARVHVEPEHITPEPVRAALDAVEAARRFHAWIMAGHCGTHSAADLDRLYRRHSAEISHVPAAIKLIKTHLGTLPGVERTIVRTPDGQGRRSRRVWTFRKVGASAVPTKTADADQRRAA